MAQQEINIGGVANDGSGEPLRDGGVKINANFRELYAGVAALQSSSSGGAALNGIVSGCGVAYADNLDFDLSAGTYYIDGSLYGAEPQSLSLDAADGANSRIDVLYLDDTGTFGKITGTPAANPSQPAVDPTTQLFLTFVLVPAAATDLVSQIVNETIYDEGAEWVATTSGVGFTVDSVNNPYQGTKDIEGTAVAAGAYVKFVRASAISFDGDGNLLLRVQSKANWNNKRWLTLRWYDGGVAMGTAVSLKSGTFGFDSSNTAGYQLVVIPKQAFAVPLGTLIDELRITDVGGSIGFYIDAVVFQTTGDTGSGGGGSTSVLTQEQGDARYVKRSRLVLLADQTAYDALNPPDEETFYFIPEA